MVHLIHKFKSIICTLIMGTLVVGCGNDSDDKKDSNTDSLSYSTVEVATDLNTKKLKPISDAYKDLTGINIVWVPFSVNVNDLPSDTNSAEELQLLQKLLSNQQNQSTDNQTGQPNINNNYINIDDNTVDMVLMHSAYTVNALAEHRELQPIGSQKLINRVPIQYQDIKGRWFGISNYAMTLVYDKNKVNGPELLNYAGLADEKWFGRLCMTAVDSPENQAIAKTMVSYRGNTKAREVLAGWNNNMGSPSKDDDQILKAIEQGRCEVGIVNSDAFWDYAKNNPQTSVRLKWANQINRGAITNTLTAGLAKSGNNAGLALSFIEWLTSDIGQALLAFHTSTFPIVQIADKSVDIIALRPEWTQFEADPTRLIDVMDNNTIVLPKEHEKTNSLDPSKNLTTN